MTDDKEMMANVFIRRLQHIRIGLLQEIGEKQRKMIFLDPNDQLRSVLSACIDELEHVDQILYKEVELLASECLDLRAAKPDELKRLKKQIKDGGYQE